MNEEEDPVQPPEGTARWEPDLTAEGKAEVELLRGEIERSVRIMQKIRAALGMSESEFLALLQKDEHEGLPHDVPRPSLSLLKLRDAVEQRGGTLGIIITIDGQIHSIA